jgi:hypothetical protein
MNQSDTELIFPIRAVHSLVNARNGEWEQFVNHLTSSEVTQIEQLAFVLLIARLAGCGSCNSDSFRAMRGCSHCASQIVRRQRGENQELFNLFNQAKVDVKKFVEKNLT